MGLRDNNKKYWVQVAALVVLILCVGAAQGQIQSNQCLGGCRKSILMCSANCASKAFSPHSQATMQEMATCLGACGAQTLGCMGECLTMLTSLPGSPGEPPPSPAAYQPAPPPTETEPYSLGYID